MRDLLASIERWRAQRDRVPHGELTEIILDEFRLHRDVQKDRSADAARRLENLKELVRSMQDFEKPARFPRTHFPGDGS